MPRRAAIVWTFSVCLALVACATSAVAGEVITKQSRNFRLVTDMSEADADELLKRLETMLTSVSRYWGRRCPKTIDMYVASDVSTWPESILSRMAPEGIASIRRGGGLTLTQTMQLGGRKIDSRSVVYAVDRRGTPQHEAVHAYCGLTFGATGPVWYAEGMAEVGQYWRENDPAAVNASEEVINYLRTAEPKSLEELVAPNQQTGDSWQNYAWRWALCHQLGFNPNYQKRFKPLGLALLAEQNVTFYDAYGPQVEEIEFEYRLFLKNLTPGYRADLCHWDWRSKIRPVRNRGSVATVNARRGWQTTPLLVTPEKTYRVTSDATWLVDENTKTDLDGHIMDGAERTADVADGGRGRLVATIFADGEITEEIELGADTTFTPPSRGQLVLRCRDEWDAIADNKGTATVRVQPVE